MKKLYILLLAAFTLCTGQSNGNHLLDVSLSYTHVAGNQYFVSVRMYRDCQGLPGLSTLSVCLYSESNSYNTSFLLPLTSTTILPALPYVPPGVSSCSGGSAFGIERIIYSDTIVVPFPASDWVFASSLEGFSSMMFNQRFFGGTTMDNLNFPGNSSPTFVYDPKFLYCSGAPSWEDYLATDADGDTLVYSIAPMMLDTLICPNQPYVDTTLNWMNIMSQIPVYIDSVAGWINFTMNSVGMGVITIKVDEIRNGVVIGSTKQIQYSYHVSNCTILGMEEGNSKNSPTIFPSPAGSEVNLRWDKPSSAGTLICSDFSGKEVLKQEISLGTQDFRIDISGLNSGVYNLRFIEQADNPGASLYSLRFLKL